MVVTTRVNFILRLLCHSRTCPKSSEETSGSSNSVNINFSILFDTAAQIAVSFFLMDACFFISSLFASIDIPCQPFLYKEKVFEKYSG